MGLGHRQIGAFSANLAFIKFVTTGTKVVNVE